MRTYSNQKGTVLFISLIILLILTILGLTSMQGSIVQEKMTAAVRDGRVALEGAEATLHFVEKQVIESMATTGNFDDTACLYTDGNGPKQDGNGVWPANLWTGTGSCIADAVNARGASVVGGSDGSLAEPPRYFIELAGILENVNATNIMVFNYNDDAGAGDVLGFKIVIRSAGSSSSSQKFISAYYGKRF
jgi:type IV pilus assembly protein PilX